MLVCHCNNLTDSTIRKAIQEADGELSKAMTELGYVPDCGACTEPINEIVREHEFQSRKNLVHVV